MHNSDQENTAENQMAKALGCILALGGLAALALIGVGLFIVRLF